SLTSVTPTSVISGTVLTNPSSSNERAKATISSSYMSNSGDEIEDDESNDSRDENLKTEISENEYFTNESNDSTDQSSNDNEHFKSKCQSQKNLSIRHLSPTGSQQSANEDFYLSKAMDPYNYGLMAPNIHDVNLIRAQYTQDENNIQQSIDNGPLYESCRCHALLCWQISPSTSPVNINLREDLNSLSGHIFEIEQLTYRCLSCETSYSTIFEYEKHRKDEIHLKRRSNSKIEENNSH
ncbi:unnamed protein product, partial [Rotaria sordida]